MDTDANQEMDGINMTRSSFPRRRESRMSDDTGSPPARGRPAVLSCKSCESCLLLFLFYLCAPVFICGCCCFSGLVVARLAGQDRLAVRGDAGQARLDFPGR